MNNIAIKVEGLGKKYTIKHEKREPYKTFQDVLLNSGKKIITSLNPFTEKTIEDETTEEFWALKDVNFEINKGDKVGIIGRNGAGKSTLLKVLSRITEPTTGKIHINGRIASLLEVGTGFHPELTGRENIFLNGAILGMSRAEIKAKFDEIVAFAEVEKFLDTPVKRYSSGMYVRLAFSVAAHLEPEILVVDEVLAVGDVEFQKKCLGKMGEVSEDGRTVIFVSHNMGAIGALCNRGILLNHGEVEYQSNNIRDLIDSYFKDNGNMTTMMWENKNNKYHNIFFTPQRFFLTDAKTGQVLGAPISNDRGVYVNVEFIVEKNIPEMIFGYRVYSSSNELIYVSHATDVSKELWPNIKKGINIFKSLIPPRFLNEGTYRIELVASLYKRVWIIEPGKEDINLFFTIKGGLSDSEYWTHNRGGLIAPIFKWEQL